MCVFILFWMSAVRLAWAFSFKTGWKHCYVFMLKLGLKCLCSMEPPEKLLHDAVKNTMPADACIYIYIYIFKSCLHLCFRYYIFHESEISHSHTSVLTESLSNLTELCFKGAKNEELFAEGIFKSHCQVSQVYNVMLNTLICCCCF